MALSDLVVILLYPIAFFTTIGVCFWVCACCLSRVDRDRNYLRHGSDGVATCQQHRMFTDISTSTSQYRHIIMHSANFSHFSPPVHSFIIRSILHRGISMGRCTARFHPPSSSVPSRAPTNNNNNNNNPLTIVPPIANGRQLRIALSRCCSSDCRLSILRMSPMRRKMKIYHLFISPFPHVQSIYPLWKIWSNCFPSKKHQIFCEDCQSLSEKISSI
jgi:hypothetical protein